jgi:FlaA1/EpsC-like NDP-sugar epimerase
MTIREAILLLPRSCKQALVAGTDAFLCLWATWGAFSIVYSAPASVGLAGMNEAAVASVCLALPVFYLVGIYRAIFRFNGINALITLAKGVAIYWAGYVLLMAVVGVENVPRSLAVVQPMLLLLLAAVSRVVAHRLLINAGGASTLPEGRTRVLIYGAGAAGRELAAAMSRSASHRACGFLDDDARLHGHHLDGLKVYNPGDLSHCIQKLAVKEVLLAIPSAPQRRRLEIIDELRRQPVHVRTLPGLSALASGKVGVADLRELDIEDLLGRDAVPPNGLLMSRHIHGKVVLVTGAGGSIGSELCRQIAACKPARLLLVELSEFALYSVHRELSTSGIEVIPLLGSVCDEPRMAQILSTWRPHTVYHTAAYKHVPMVEHNPAQGVSNNVWGTLVCARAALAAGVQQFVLISTDKAVRPTNIMGASKRLAEMVLQALAELVHDDSSRAKGTCFAMVRFGNVLGSSGSVVPLFREQIARGGPLTLTHADITRYFMTIPEAAQLVIQAGAMAAGGEVYVLDMGQPVRIMDLACRLVELSGLKVRDGNNPDGDIEIQVTGLRPGEKLYEELLIGENPEPTAHPRIMKAREAHLPWAELEGMLRELRRRLDANDVPGLKATLETLVSGYRPEREVVDWVWRQSELMSHESVQSG